MTADFTLTKIRLLEDDRFPGQPRVAYSDVKFDTPIPKQVLGTSASVILSDGAISGKQVEWDFAASLHPHPKGKGHLSKASTLSQILFLPMFFNKKSITKFVKKLNHTLLWHQLHLF